MARPFLPVIKTITLDDGTQLEPADELRISTGLEAEAVEEDGRTWIRLSASATSPSILVPQAAVLAAGPAVVFFVIAAAAAAAIPVSRIQIIPHATTTQDPSDYARVAIDEYDSSGLFARSLFDGPVFNTYSNNFASMSTAMVATLEAGYYTLPLGSTLVARWSKIGSGADVLGATWILT